MKSLFEEMGGTYRQEGDYLMLCEFLFFSLQSIHLCNMKQNGHQNAAFGCFALMPFYAPIFYRSDNDYRNSVVSFCNTVLLFD